MEVVNFTAAMASILVAPAPAIGTKVVCSYPVAVIWQNVLGYLVLAYAITQCFRPITWCKGYKYNKKCALYIYIYICCAMARRPPFPMNYVSWFPSELRGKAVPSTESPYSSRLLERDNQTLPFCHVAKSQANQKPSCH